MAQTKVGQTGSPALDRIQEYQRRASQDVADKRAVQGGLAPNVAYAAKDYAVDAKDSAVIYTGSGRHTLTLPRVANIANRGLSQVLTIAHTGLPNVGVLWVTALGGDRIVGYRSRIPIGPGDVLAFQATRQGWIVVSAGSGDDSVQYRVVSDFTGTTPAADFIATVTGGTWAAIASTAGRPGVQQGDTAGVATNTAGVMSAPLAVLLGGGSLWYFRSDVRVPTLSTGAERFTVRSGFADSVNATEPTDGVYFRYTDLASANWVAVCRSNNVETVITTGAVVTAAAWNTLEIVVSGDGRMAEFFVGGRSVGTTTTNIPQATGRNTGMLPLSIAKSVGITARQADIDLCEVISWPAVAR